MKLKKWVWIVSALFMLVVWAQPQPVNATTTAVLNVDKRVSAADESSSQETVPLAGARYRVTRIQASGGAPIDATKADSYRAVTGAAALSTVLATDAKGQAQLTGLSLGATYLVEELAGTGVDKPSAPVVLVFDATHAVYTYTPKSGLTGGVDVPHGSLPDTQEPVGNGTVRHTSTLTGNRQAGDTILQTGGQLRLLGAPVVAALLALLMLTGFAAVTLRKKQLS